MNHKAGYNKNEVIITTTCCYDCGGRCLLKVYVKDGKISHISTENRDGLHIKACPRGLAQKAVAYETSRLMQPLKRLGSRGNGKFEPISWDEALQTITAEIQRAKKQYGTESIYFITNTGSMGTLHNTSNVTQRFFSFLGKCTTTWGDPSCEGALQSSLATFGTPNTGSTRDNLKFSKLIILWGWDPVVTRFGSDTTTYLSQAKKAGVKIICVDPRQNQSAKALADEWIPVKPGTDTAMLSAMAYVMITEELYDKDFVEKYTFGFDKFGDYVTGKKDGVDRNPEWARAICGAPVELIVKLARDYAGVKPAALMTGWAPGRTAYGEQFHRAASTISAITGNIGIEGGHTAGGPGIVDIGLIGGQIPVPKTDHQKVHITDLYDALIRGKPNENHLDCKLLYIAGCNLLNQNLNLNKGKKALLNPEFIVVHDLFLTPTAKYADIVLPINHFFEREDIGQPFIGGPYCIYMNKIYDALPGPKSDLEIFSEIAIRLGIENYNDKPDEQWLKTFLKAKPDLPDLQTLKTIGVQRFELKRPLVSFREQIEEPDKYPFSTPSGKIEIFSHMFAEMNNPSIPPIPTFIAPWEGLEDQLAQEYPIQLISTHSKARANSQFDNIERIKKLGDDDIWINTADAHKRGIESGDMAVVFNQRGQMCKKAKVTPRVMPGVASIDQGQWYRPDDQGTDFGGCTNVLTQDKMSPAGAFPCNTCLVRIEKL